MQLDHSNRELGHGLSAEQLLLIYDEERGIQEDFERFHRENPRIYRKIVNLCREAKACGHEHFSMDCIFHRLRWYMTVERKSKEPFKLNDHYTARYARMVMATEPDLCDFFEIRKLRARPSPK